MSKANCEKRINEKAERFLKIGRQYKYWDRGYDFPRMCRQVFRGINLEGKNFLEIGCGNGTLSIWAGICEASAVVALEPFEDGSGSFDQSSVFSEFSAIAKALGISNSTIIPKTIQDYHGDIKFDVVLSNASVNHLHEESCVELKSSEKARDEYVSIFNHIAAQMNPGGKLIIIDCSSSNFFNDIGLTNPFMKSIEWHKHHTPQIWKEICTKAGFSNAVITWPSGRYLRYLRIFERPQVLSYFTDSFFRLEMTYTGRNP